MTEKRLIVDDDYAWIDTFTNTVIEIEDALDLVNKLWKENEELKKELKVYREVASCGNCKYQNYDWFEDGDEFEICEKGNNNQQIEYHICKEWDEF